MSEHKCDKEEVFREILITLKNIDVGLRGNGTDRPGLFTEFAVWKNTVAGLVCLDVIIVGGLVALWLKA